MKRLTGALIALTFLLGTTSPAIADSQSDIMTMLQSMKQQMAQMQATIESQSARIQQLEGQRAIEMTPSSEGAPVQPLLNENDWQKGIKDNIGEAVPWMKGAKFSGDFRLRYEAFEYEDNNENENITSDRTRNRFRIRLRFGFEKDYGDDWKVGFRMATATAGTNGLATDNASTNVTLGNPGYFTYKNFFIDRAFAQYSPNGLKDYGPIKGVTIGAGKFENPFLRYSTPMMWDGDVTPEGIYEKVTLQLASTEENKLNLYGVLGQFITNENSGVDTDAGLYGYQGALHWSTYNFGTDKPVEFTGALSYYDATDWSNTVTSNTVTSTSFLRTNTLAADNFRILDFYPEMTFGVWNQMPLTLWYNYLRNVGNVGTENSALALGNDIHDMDTAWGLGLKLGKTKKKGDWEASYGYYEIGANSVIAAFNDSDFGGPGGVGHTNRQGHKFGLAYQLTDAVTVNWTGYVVTPLNPNTAVANSLNETVFRSQADVVYKF